MSCKGDGSDTQAQTSEEEMKKKQEEIRRKKEEIRKRVAIARKQQDLEIARKQAEQAQKQQSSATEKKEKASPSASSSDDGVLRIDEGYAHFKILPHDDERGNPNFPYNLHNACELFCRTGNVQCAVQVKHCVDTYRGLLAAGPDGRTGVSVGRATVCWLCGYTGLPLSVKNGKVVTQVAKGNAQPSKQDLLNPSTAEVKCAGCGESAQLNFVLANTAAESAGGGGGATGSDKSMQVLPWIEVAVKAAEKK